MKRLVPIQKQELLMKLERASHLAKREEICHGMLRRKGEKKSRNVRSGKAAGTNLANELEKMDIEASLELIEAGFTEPESKSQREERELLDKIELSLDKGELTQAILTFEKFLDMAYNTQPKFSPKDVIKCTTMWSIRHFASLVEGEPTRAELLAERTIKKYEQTFYGGRIEKKREAQQPEDSMLVDIYEEFENTTGGSVDEFVKFVRKGLENWEPRVL